ncbi:MAG: class I SAM-dependent methyltransferase, partial [Candidatus Methanofastidiosia archaeon]
MRIEDELKKLPREFVRVVERIPLRDEKPLPSDWLRCQIVERFRILENLEIKNGENILEVGSGPHAIATIALAHSVGKKGRVVAVDLERWNFFEDTLRNAGVLRRVIPLKCDARNLPFPYEFFDKGVSIHVLRSFKSKEDILKIFREMLRVTRNEIFIATSLPIAKNKAQMAHL